MAKKNIKEAFTENKGAKAAKKLGDDFKKFAFKGNIVDMAVGVVIGSAFTAIVNSLVKDLITPAISMLTGANNYTDMFVVLKEGTVTEGVNFLADGSYATLADAVTAGAVTLNYGNFIQAIINFFLIAISVFVVVSIIKAADVKAKKQAAAEAAAAAEAEAAAKALLKTCPYCLTEIHVNATRCPHCTSEQAVVENAEA
jgi:large conductance mechanosensitive channel